jgi:hypothetical protein
MFYCNSCAKNKTWPITFLKSVGVCEICGSYSYCNDCPSFKLPNSSPKAEVSNNEITVDEAGLFAHRLYTLGSVSFMGFLSTLDTSTGSDIVRVYSLTNINKVLHEGPDSLSALTYIRDLLKWTEE